MKASKWSVKSLNLLQKPHTTPHVVWMLSQNLLVVLIPQPPLPLAKALWLLIAPKPAPNLPKQNANFYMTMRGVSNATDSIVPTIPPIAPMASQVQITTKFEHKLMLTAPNAAALYPLAAGCCCMWTFIFWACPSYWAQYTSCCCCHENFAHLVTYITSSNASKHDWGVCKVLVLTPMIPLWGSTHPSVPRCFRTFLCTAPLL